jgi:hypothetical protein
MPRRLLEGPRPDTFAAFPGAAAAGIGDHRYRRSARGIAGAIDALPPVDAAVDVLLAIARGGEAPTCLRHSDGLG